MKIVVCIKQVPNTNEVKLDPKTGTLIREGIPSIINPDDKNALEAALVLKEEMGAFVTVLTMGPPQAEIALREALAMGADEAILLSDRAFAGSDTWATSLTLAQAIRKIGNYTIILCGRQAIDGDTAQVGPELAQHLDLPQVTYVRKILGITKDSITVERALEDGYMTIESDLPVLLTAVKELSTPRYPLMRGIVDAFETKEITVWGLEDLGGDPERLGLKGSPTQVKRTFNPPGKTPGRIIEGAPRVAVNALIDELLAKNILKEV